MTKFKTPVAMKVTKEQYEKDLKYPLKELGYRSDFSGEITTKYKNLVTGDALVIDKINVYSDGQYDEGIRYIIPGYNPKLFLAIAAKTEGKEWIIGEYLTYIGKSEPYKVKGFEGVSLNKLGLAQQGSDLYKKATLEELTNHFSKPKETFELPKKWKLEVTKENVNAVNKWKVSIGRSYILASEFTVDQDGYCRLKKDFTSPGYALITTEQFMEHVYKPAFKKEIPEEFYVKYCEGFTEDIFNELRNWSAKNGDVGGEAGIYIGYAEFIRQDKTRYYIFEKDCPNGDWSFGVDNNIWNNVKTEYTLEQVKELINYKPKTNKNEYKEDSYERESKEIKQIDEDLDSISSREGGKEIKIGTVSSRNFCQRGSIESSNSITSPRRSSSRIRAERGRLYI